MTSKGYKVLSSTRIVTPTGYKDVEGIVDLDIINKASALAIAREEVKWEGTINVKVINMDSGIVEFEQKGDFV